MNWRKRSSTDKIKFNEGHKSSAFEKCVVRLRSMVYRNTDEFNEQIGGLLEEMNLLDYDGRQCQNEEVGLCTDWD